MRTPLKTLIIASALVTGIAAAPALYAQSSADTPSPQVPPSGQGNMMGQVSTPGQGDMMGMRGMMKMMGQMGQMAETHNKIMQSMIDALAAAQSNNAQPKKK